MSQMIIPEMRMMLCGNAKWTEGISGNAISLNGNDYLFVVMD
jgi:hypothetical protein